jgi:hypothetical protein
MHTVAGDADDERSAHFEAADAGTMSAAHPGAKEWTYLTVTIFLERRRPYPYQYP